MNRFDFQLLSKLRRKEAAALIKSGHYVGAYYLLGYAVECALKACIAKNTERHVFPRKDSAKLYTHELSTLRDLAELSAEMNLPQNTAVQVNWAIVKDWSEQSRYELSGSRALARDFYSACTARKNGVLPWISRKW
jgi:hypothetical protein